jgi:hypothetical protein
MRWATPEIGESRRLAMNATTCGWPIICPAVFGNRHPHGATDLRLRSDEPQANQHQYAGQDGEQEAIGNAGRHVATD